MPIELRERQQEPLLIVVSGPSGVGKDSVLLRMKERDLPFHFVVTATTRERRKGEEEGVDYFFVSRERFESMIEVDQLIEYALVYGEYKGVPKQQVVEALKSGEDVIMRLDVQGAETVRRLAPEALLIFLDVEDEAELTRRLKARRTETEQARDLRLATARDERKRVNLFDYYVINARDHLDETVDSIIAIIRAEHLRTHPRQVRL
jgi:guanylate kinase